MSSSYIVRAMFLLIKLTFVLPPPLSTHPTLKTALIAHVCDCHSASQENETARKEGGKRCVWSGADEIIIYTPLRNGQIFFFLNHIRSSQKYSIY